MRDTATPVERERAERFLSAYARIEQTLQRRLGHSRGRESLRRLVDIAARSDSVVRRYRDDLAEFADLRNAIVHERVTPDRLIAVPLPSTVASIERIAGLLQDPPLVYPRYAREVVKFDADEPLKNVLIAINLKGYSQFPVYRSGVYAGLLTDGGVARFLAAAALGKVSLSDSTPVHEALSLEKNVSRGRFISRAASVFDAEESFKSGGDGRWNVAALLITEHGEPDEELLGIITPYDALSWELE